MTKNDTAFKNWFDYMANYLADSGIDFRDEDAVRDEYESGKDFHDVADEIKLEYGFDFRV